MKTRSSVSGSSSRSARSLEDAVQEAVQGLATLAEVSPDALSDFLSERRKKKKEERKVFRPSDLVHRRNWKELQFKNLGKCSDAPRFICYRGPPETAPHVPLLLLHESFMDFCLNAEAFSELKETDMEAALRLWKLCSMGWDDEKGMSPAMNAFFSKYLKKRVLPTDCMDGFNEKAMTIFEYKTEPLDGWFQGLDYWRRRFLEVESFYRESHGLLVLIACPYIQVVAVVMDWEREKLLAEPLTTYENCFGPAHNVHRVAGLLRAVKIFSSSYVIEPAIDCNVPFVFKDKVTQKLGGKFVYLLGKDRVGKITRHYGEKAHRSWEQEGVAPALLGVESIGNGWLQVEMFFLGIEEGWRDAAEVVLKCKEHPSSLENLVSSIRAAAQKGHSTGYVHGDLRLPNIKVRERDGLFHIMFVDFGWAGREDEATYPSLLNPDVSWHPEAEFGKKITAAHDLHFVDKLVEQLANLYTSSATGS